MQPLSRVSTDELSSLVMENELLRYEVTHLRARLAAAEKAARKAKRGLADVTSESTGGAASDAVPGAAGEGETQIREDMVWLLRRIDSSPIGRLVRRRPGIRALRERYLGAQT